MKVNLTLSMNLMTIACAMLVTIACAQNKNTSMTKPDYEKAWKEVKDFENKGLPESALKAVNNIYAQAVKENNSAQLVKAVIHQLKFADVKEENALVKNLQNLKAEADKAVFPVKPLLHSMLAELYWQYYQNNRYKFYNRTQTAGENDSDIETWSLPKIVSETFHQYRLSLEDDASSKKTSIGIYEEIIIKGNAKGRRYHPTLYDFLAHRALDFSSNQEAALPQPTDAFVMDDEAYYSPGDEFIGVKIETKDSLSSKYFALTLLQDLIHFHIKDTDIEVLTDVDLKRLTFVNENSVNPEKEALYSKALGQLAKKTAGNEVSTRVTHLKALIYQASASLYKPLEGDKHKWDLKHAIDLCDSAINKFKDSEGADLCERVKDEIHSKSITSTIEEHNLTGQPFRALVGYKNFDKLFYRIIKVTRDDVRSQRKKWLRNYNVDQEQKFVEYFASKYVVKNGEFKLPLDGDFQIHNIEVKLDALPVGDYMVLFSNKSDFNLTGNALAYAFTTITEISYMHRNTRDGGTDCFVLNSKTGEPISQATAIAYRTVYNYKKSVNEIVKIGTFVSDHKGFFHIAHFNAESRQTFFLEFTKNDDFASTISIDNQDYYPQISQYKYGEPGRSIRTHFFLDRAIYRPGQTIYFKGLVVASDGKSSAITPKYSASVSLYDVNNQIKETVQVTTNEYGTYSGSFTAPSTGLTGQMRLQDDGYTGAASFSVEEYKRPKFEVTFDTLKGSVRLNDVVKAHGKAMAYSGAAIDGANVTYKVTREARYPIWWMHRWGNFESAPARQILQGIAKTDVEGKFIIDFSAIPDLSVDKASDPIFNYTISADVTDINGETHSQTTTVAVGYKSLEVGVAVDDVNIDNVKANQEFHINTTNLAGNFEPATGKIKIQKLKDPGRTFRDRLWAQPDKALYSQSQYYELFPYDLFADEDNKYKWPRSNAVLDTDFNTANSKVLSIKDMKSWKTGEYVLEVSSRDKDGQEVKSETYFTVYSSEAKDLATPQTDYFKMEVSTVELGAKAKFITGSSEKNIHALYEIERNGRIVSSQWVKLSNEPKCFEIPVAEQDRGNIFVHYSFIKNGRIYKHDETIVVPFTNKELDITFQTFRDKLLPGAKDQWQLLIKGKAAEKVTAEMVATLYDESLDTFRPNSWYAQLFSANQMSLNWNSTNGFEAKELTLFERAWNVNKGYAYLEASFDYLNWFEFNMYNYGSRMVLRGASSMGPSRSKKSSTAGIALDSAAPAMAEREEEKASDGSVGFSADTANKAKEPVAKTDTGAPAIRTNFNETAFFFPHLMTNDKGEIVIDFTVPEALTRWKMLGFAHTKELKSGFTTNHLVTQKELMVVPNQPRFFREGDKMMFAVKITSLVDAELTGNAQLEFIDPFTGKTVDLFNKGKTSLLPFMLPAKQSKNVEWAIEIPNGVQALTYRVVAKAGNFSDGEEMTIPVLTNTMLVTESMPLPMRGKESKDFAFDKLVNNTSTTLRHQQLTLEFTSNPAWYAVQALPYLMEYPYDCVEQTFSKYYANSLASHIANSSPRIKQVFDTWRNIQPDALLSNLEKNQELKTAILEETPWVLQANDESQRKRNVGLLFDLNRMANEMDRALSKVAKAQNSSGGFSWFPGFPDDRFMTQYIVSSMGHLDVLGVKAVRTEHRSWAMIQNAVKFLDNQLEDDYRRLKALAEKKQIKLEENHLSYIQIQHLYARSFFKDIAIEKEHQESFNYFLGQAKTYWLTYKNIYIEGLTALALYRFGDKETTLEMLKSFKERSLKSEEMGMYWKNDRGYFWYQAPIETQALMIEVFDEVGNDQPVVEGLKVWLLKQKQTQDWKTTKATSEACYALLRRGTDILANTTMPVITVGSVKVDPAADPETRVEAGTGYFKTAWKASEINSSMGKIHIEKQDQGVAWGAMYWQYFEQLDKITPAETPLQLKKDLYKQSNTSAGKAITSVSKDVTLSVGDLVKVRIELRVDRDMEYVHLKDMRAAGLEPVSTLSTYRYQDGLYYYESTRDMATNFFIGYLPKGTYVFEYDLRVSQKGDFSNGITTVQCMYAPEFTSHSQGIRLTIK
ncbi:MAG: alpha-2-macroglobulin family protein [Chryseolinea sp.]